MTRSRALSLQPQPECHPVTSYSNGPQILWRIEGGASKAAAPGKRGTVVKLPRAFAFSSPRPPAHIQTSNYTGHDTAVATRAESISSLCTVRRGKVDSNQDVKLKRANNKLNWVTRTWSNTIAMRDSYPKGDETMAIDITSIHVALTNSNGWDTFLTLGMQRGCCWRTHHTRSFAPRSPIIPRYKSEFLSCSTYMNGTEKHS